MPKRKKAKKTRKAPSKKIRIVTGKAYVSKTGKVLKWIRKPKPAKKGKR